MENSHNLENPNQRDSANLSKKDELLVTISKQKEKVDQAEEKFKTSAGRDEYAANIRIRDQELKQLEQLETQLLNVIDEDKSVEKLQLDLEHADHALKHAQNQTEYETAMREIDRIQKAILALKEK